MDPLQKRLYFLDAARGIAALVVVLEHAFQWFYPGYMKFSYENVAVVQAAVLIFFMISGFVIPMSLERDGANGRFWLRRLFRLAPVYWFSIFLAFVYTLADGPVPLGVRITDKKTWITNFLFLQELYRRPDVWAVFWTLHFEFAFYVTCFTAARLRIMPRVGPKSILALLGVFVLFAPLVMAARGKVVSNADHRLLILAALFGFVAYRASTGQFSKWTFRALTLAFAAAVGLGWLSLNALGLPNGETRHLWRWGVIAGLAGSLFIGLMAWEARGGRMPDFVCWLGRRSYSIYLTHACVQFLFARSPWPPLGIIATEVVAVLVVADLVHRLIERPAIAWGRRREKQFFAPKSQHAEIPFRTAA